MTTINLDQLAQELSRAFWQGPHAKNLVALFRQLLLLLANGEPVSPEQIAAATGRPREEVVALLQELPDVELDNEGNLVGMGLTLRPTPHRFEVEGRTLFTWCALDALLFPIILGKSIRIESPCPVTGTPVQLQVTAGRVENVEPAGAVVSIVIPKTTADIRGAFCNHVHFFSSSDAASRWLANNPDALILPVADAYRLGARLQNSLP